MNWTDGHMNMVKTLTQQKRLALVAAKAKEVPAKKAAPKKKATRGRRGGSSMVV